MRISDWSSDVCSSDLPAQRLIRALARGMGMEEPDHLAEPAFAERIWRTSGGVTGNFKRILPWSGKVARRHDRRFVTQDEIPEALNLFTQDRKTGVEGKSVSVSVDLGGRRLRKKNTYHIH